MAASCINSSPRVPAGPVPDWSKEAAPSVSKGTVLVVDDDADIRILISNVLHAAGFRVIDAPSGPDALEKIALYGCSIDLLVTDLIMPGMTGRAVADALLSWCPGVEVIFMSGYVDDARLETCDKNLHYLQKPFNRKKLTTLVSSVLKRR